MPAESFRVASKSLELFIPRKETVPLERGTEGHDTDVAAAQEFEKRFLRPALVGQHALEAGAEIGVDPAGPSGRSSLDDAQPCRELVRRRACGQLPDKERVVV